MSQYLVLSHIKVQNANSIAGFTWGFPGVSQFLGFTHALNRKFSDQYQGQFASELTGCAIIANHTHNKVYQPKDFADYEFLQSKNPPVLAKHKTKPPPIIEEGKVNLTVSLVLSLDTPLILQTEQIKALESQLKSLCLKLRIAGGSVLDIASVKLFAGNTEDQKSNMLRSIKRLCMPGFILQDRSEYLEKHVEQLQKHSTKGHSPENNSPEDNSCNLEDPSLLDAWLQFSALTYKASKNPKSESNSVISKQQSASQTAEIKTSGNNYSEKANSDKDNSDKKNTDKDNKEPDAFLERVSGESVSWERVPRPNNGYLVPLMTGFKAISPVYEKGQVATTRDPDTPARFVEAVHSIGEWKSLHAVTDLDPLIWHYNHDGDWYLCQQNINGANAAAQDSADTPAPDVNQNLIELFS